MARNRRRPGCLHCGKKLAKPLPGANVLVQGDRDLEFFCTMGCAAGYALSHAPATNEWCPEHSVWVEMPEGCRYCKQAMYEGRS
jgi:ribosomal protein L24E